MLYFGTPMLPNYVLSVLKRFGTRLAGGDDITEIFVLSQKFKVRGGAKYHLAILYWNKIYYKDIACLCFILDSLCRQIMFVWFYPGFPGGQRTQQRCMAIIFATGNCWQYNHRHVAGLLCLGLAANQQSLYKPWVHWDITHISCCCRYHTNLYGNISAIP